MSTKSFTIHNHKNITIVNADDFGYNSDIDRGIIELLKANYLSSLSAIVNGTNIKQAAQQIKELKITHSSTYFNCSIGLHFNITEGPPLNPHLINSPIAPQGLFLGKPKLYEAIEHANEHLLHEIAEEARLQIISFTKLFERRPSHLDGHNHVHLIPQLACHLAPLLRQMGIYRVRFLEEKLDTITIAMNHTFLSNYRASRQAYQSSRMIGPCGFVGLESFGQLNAEPLTQALQRQQNTYKSVELMCHPGYPDKSGNAWIASQDRQRELQQLQSLSFSQFRKTKGIHSYYHLKDNKKGSKPRILIYSKLVRGCGNQTTTLRLEQMLQKMGFQVYLWNIVDRLEVTSEAHDLFYFLLNFRIALVLGVNATRSGEIIQMATRKIKIPFFLIIAGTDANIAFKDPVVVSRMRKSLQVSQCFVSLSEGMAQKTRQFLCSLGINKQVYPIVQSSCIRKVLEEEVEQNWVKPAKPYILFPTSFRKVKDVGYALKQLNQIIEQSDFQVYIAGPIIDQVYFQECSHKMGKIKYLGVLPKYIYARYLQHSFVLINTSQSEGMSCSILQALELGIPVIARSNQGNRQLVQHLHNGLIFESPEQFTTHFNTLKNNPQLRQKIIINSQQVFQQRYSNQHQTTLYTQLFHQYFSTHLQTFTVNKETINILEKIGVHPISLPNIRLFSQIQHPITPNLSIIDVGCGTGIFGLTFLSQSSLSEARIILTDISQQIVAHCIYNYHQSTLWDKVVSIEGIESDMFENVGERYFDVILFNPPQSPFRQPSSRPDKNGGTQAMKYIEPMLKYYRNSESKYLYELYSFMAWPSKFKELLEVNNLKIVWQSQQEKHVINLEQFQKMEEGLSSYILDHVGQGRAQISLEGGAFTIPAIIYQIERQ